MTDNKITQSEQTPGKFLWGVLLKAGLLFILINIVFAVIDPLPWLGRISIYNKLVPGRQRLPFGENPEKAYNFSLFQLEAMFASHEIAGDQKKSDEYRVILIGDSSVWGFLLNNEDTVSGLLNGRDGKTQAGEDIKVYNLGYPTISLTKDLLILENALTFDPDLIIWLVTLESFPYSKQLFTPLVQNNPEPIRGLISKFDLNLDPHDPDLIDRNLLEKTVVGQRRNLADMLRLQVYGTMWAATNVDQYYPASYSPRVEDLEAEEIYYGLQPPTLTASDIAFDVLIAGTQLSSNVPMLIINEPMFVSQGENSDIRYNFFYPRWVYDAYRQLLAELAEANQWYYADLWLAVENTEFTNSAIHLTPKGSKELSQAILPLILDIANK